LCEELDRRYVGDITYISTWEGWAYLATVIDLASRKVVGWAIADHMRTELVEEALEMAFVQRRPPEGVIFHSDRGCQYTSSDYGELAIANGVVLSVGRKGECWDNAVAESFLPPSNESSSTRGPGALLRALGRGQGAAWRRTGRTQGAGHFQGDDLMTSRESGPLGAPGDHL
jgi:transposase InsO family protein